MITSLFTTIYPEIDEAYQDIREKIFAKNPTIDIENFKQGILTYYIEEQVQPIFINIYGQNEIFSTNLTGQIATFINDMHNFEKAKFEQANVIYNTDEGYESGSESQMYFGKKNLRSKYFKQICSDIKYLAKI
jgi:hypothetical protein